MITLTLDGQDLSVSTPHIVADTVDYLTIKIERVSPEWQGMDLHIFFKMGTTIYELLTDGNFIGENAHLNLPTGRWSVSVTGYLYDGDQMIQKVTTNTIGLNVASPPPDAGASLPYTPPSAIEQIEAIAQGVRDDADAGVFDGATFTPSVSADGVISWENDKGKENPASVNIKGPKGDTGAQGPKGEQGVQGPQGEQGPPGATDYNDLSNKPFIPTKVSDITNDSDYQTASQVAASIAAALTSVYTPGGSVTFANLPALTAANLGKVCNVTDAFTTNSNFVEGAGLSYPAGTNVAVVNTGTDADPVYKYDAGAGFVDLSGYVQASQMATTSNADITTAVNTAYTAVFGS